MTSAHENSSTTVPGSAGSAPAHIELPLSFAVVPFPAQDLDRNIGLGIVEVDAPEELASVVNLLLHQRHRQDRASKQAVGDGLERRLTGSFDQSPGIEDAPQLRRPPDASAPNPSEMPAELWQRHDTPAKGTVEGDLDRGFVEEGAEIEEGPMHGGRRDSANDTQVALGQRGAPVNDDPGRFQRPRRRYFDQPALGNGQLPALGRGPVGEMTGRPHGRRHQIAIVRRRRSPNGKHSGMERHQVTARDAALDRAFRHAKRQKLDSRHDTELA